MQGFVVRNFFELAVQKGVVEGLTMKRLYSSPDSAQVELIRSMLEASNLLCEVRNEVVSQVMVGVQFAPELWVRDEDYEEALRLMREAREDEQSSGSGGQP